MAVVVILAIEQSRMVVGQRPAEQTNNNAANQEQSSKIREKGLFLDV